VAERREKEVDERKQRNSLPYLKRSGDFYFTASHTLNMHSLRTRTVNGQMSCNMTNYPGRVENILSSTNTRASL